MARSNYVELIVDNFGRPRVGVPVTVNIHGGGVATCWFQEFGGGYALGVATTDYLGMLSIWLDPGRYEIIPPGVGPTDWRIWDAGGIGTPGPQGIQGPPGIAGPWKGAWLVGTTYAQGEEVVRGLAKYVSNGAGNVGNDPATDNVHWTEFDGGIITGWRSVLSPRYGGDPTGVLDCTAAINNIGADGYVAYLPGTSLSTGGYLVRGTITNPFGIIGDSAGTSKLLKPSSDAACIYAPSGSIGSYVALSVDAARFDTSLTLTSTSGLAAGDYLLLNSNKDYTLNAETGRKQGEIVRIHAILSGTVVQLRGLIYDTYTVANGGHAAKITFLENTVVRDVGFVNTTPRGAGGSYLSTFMNPQFVRGLRVSGCTFTKADATALLIENCIDDVVSRSVFKEGNETTTTDIGYVAGTSPAYAYGCVHYGACQNSSVVGCVSDRNYGAFFVDPHVGDGGIPRHIVVSGCVSWGAAKTFATHVGCEFVKFVGCTAHGGDRLGTQQEDGIFQLEGKYCSMQNCIVDGTWGFGSAVYLGSQAVDCEIDGLTIRNALCVPSDAQTHTWGTGLTDQGHGSQVSNVVIRNTSCYGILVGEPEAGPYPGWVGTAGEHVYSNIAIRESNQGMAGSGAYAFYDLLQGDNLTIDGLTIKDEGNHLNYGLVTGYTKPAQLRRYRNVTGIVISAPLIHPNASLLMLDTENVRPVGSGSNPAFIAAYGNTGAGLRPLMFFRDGSGTVHIEGSILSSAAIASNGIIFQLPATGGYRPTYAVQLSCLNVTTPGAIIATAMNVDTSGNVYIPLAVSSGTYLSISASFHGGA